MGDMEWIGYAQPNVPVDAGAGVPARVGVPRMIHAHRDNVCVRAEFQAGRQVIRKLE